MKNLRSIVRSIIFEMAVRKDILDSVKGTRKKTMLLRTKLDFSSWSSGRRYQFGYGQAIKPEGLWYGYGSEWIEFATDPANKGLSGMVTNAEYFYELDVHYTDLENPDEDKVLFLKNHDELERLTELLDGQIRRAGGMLLVNWRDLSELLAA